VGAPGKRSHQQIRNAYANLPLAFIENRGQVDRRVRYHAQGRNFAFYLTPEEIVLRFAKKSAASVARRSNGRPQSSDHPSMVARPSSQGITLALRFIGANPQTILEGEARRPGNVNYLQGNNSARWHRQVPGFEQVVYRELWPGVDLMLRGQRGELKYEFRVRPGARLADIALDYRGATGLTLDDSGALLIDTSRGILRDSAPISYQTISGKRVPVKSRYVLKQGGEAAREYGFVVGAGYDPRHELIIDPGVEYSTFLGGAAGDSGAGIAVDSAGNAYIVGTTQSLDFPATAGAFDGTLGNPDQSPDVFVSKLDSTGSILLYATYLGGSKADFGRAIAVDSAGDAYVMGRTHSANFPTTAGAFDTTANFPSPPRLPDITDVFVTKLNANGSGLVYSTYLGGIEDDGPGAIAIDATGNAYVTGYTLSNDFPTTAGAFTTVRGGEHDAFVTKLNATGTALVYSTFLGGLVSDNADGLAVDLANNAFVLGQTRSADFPTTLGAFDTTHNGGFDLFVTKLNATGSALVYSTFLGGAGFDQDGGLAIDAEGNAYVAAWTDTPDFPTTPDAFDISFDGAGDAIVAKLNPFGSGLVYSTYLGGIGVDAAVDIAIDGENTAWVTGTTNSADFPVTADGFDLAFQGVFGAFVTGLNATGSALVYSTFLGGANADNGADLALDGEGNVYVTGTTHSADFPTTPGALDVFWDGDPLPLWGDGFVTKFGVAIVTPPVEGPTLSALSVNPSTVLGGNPVTGTVTLSGAATSGGAVVTLSSSNVAATVPTSVTVPVGATSANFTVNTSVMPENTTLGLTISGILGSSRSATLTLEPPPPLLSGLSVSPTSVVGGNSATGTVTLSAAQSGATIITLQPPPPTAPATVPANVTVPAGATSASFAITTASVSNTFNLNLGSRVEGADSPGPTALLLITPGEVPTPTLSALSVSPTSVVGGDPLTLTVTMSSVAPSGGSVVTLSSNTAAVTVPASLTVAAGATNRTFTLGTTSVTAATTATISGASGGVTRSATVTVNPASPVAPTVDSFTASPATITSGEPATLAWTTTGADSVSIDGGVGLPADGSTTVSPTATTTYNLTATGPGGTENSTVTVTVSDPPQATTSTFSGRIDRNATITRNILIEAAGQIDAGLSWDDNRASLNLTARDPNGTVLGAGSGSNPMNVSFATTTSGTYSFVISNTTRRKTDYTLSVTHPVGAPAPPAPPSITAQPSSVIVTEGAAASFSVTASGTGLGYQWRQGGVTINGANSATLLIAVTVAGDAGSYDVVVSNTGGSVTSAAAILTVNAPVVAPSITAQPSGVTVIEGVPASFSVTASGTGLGYQWRKGGVTISGANSATLLIAATVAGDAGSYDVVVSNSGGSVTSAAATLTVNAPVAPPSITAQPSSVTVTEGAPASFSVTASGTGLGYQWRKGGVTISGANSSVFSIASTVAGDAGSYDVVVSNGGGSVTSAAATLTVNVAPPSIIAQPTSLTVTEGAPASFSVTASGTGLGYQWRKGGVTINGANSATLLIAATVAGDAGSYDVVVSNASGSVTSAVATLIVNAPEAPPTITAQPSGVTVIEGAPASFSVTASGTGLGYQWRKGGVTINGATAAIFSIAATVAGDAGSYDVVVSNGGGSVTSNAAALTVEAAPPPPPAALTLTVSAPASEARGDEFTASATIANDGGSPAAGLTATLTWSPSGTLRLRNGSAAQSVSVPANGSTGVNWTLRGDNEGPVTLTVTLTDGSGTVAQQSVSMQISN